MYKKISFFCSFLLLMSIIYSCKSDNKTAGSSNTNDFKSLSSQFAEPAKEYGTAPLYVWNTVITTELIDRTMADLKDKGFGGVFIHPRPGLITEYISDHWYNMYRYTVNKGKELGMDVWIYDENSYPSGFAGGHVPAEMPESYNQGQGLVMHKFDILPDTADSYFLCLKEENGQIIDITGKFNEEKGKKGNYRLFSKTYHGKSPWFGGFSYVDLLYPGVTEKFIEITLDGYKKVVGDEFGKTIPGWFTDEPEIRPPGGIYWTPDLFTVFQEKWGYDLKINLPSIFEEIGDWKKVRHNYTQTLLQLFIDRWAKICFEYCEANNLKFTGHYWEHGWPDMAFGGDNMAMYAWHQMPAIDMLFNQFNEVSPQAQFGNIRSVKELASVANQMGYNRTLSETYGGGGWDETFRDFKRLGDWEYVLGVNFMNQHLSHLSIAGARKYDYPPTFSAHSPWWDYYKPLNMHYARLSLALSAGDQVNDILILEPNTSIWLYYAYAYGSNHVWNIGNAFQALVTSLEKAQVEYDLGSENIIKDQGKVNGNKFTINKRSYSKVVIPSFTENLDSPTFRLLKEFAENGGTILAFAQPTHVDGSVNTEITEFFKSDKVTLLGDLNPTMYTKEFANNGFNITMEPGGNLYHHRRMMNDGQVLFLVNSSMTEYATGKITLNGQDAVELNTLTGEIYDYPENAGDKQLSIDYNIPPAGSLLLYIFDKQQKTFEMPVKANNYTVVEAAGTVAAKPQSSNVLTIDFCDLQLGKEKFNDMHVFYAADKAFKAHGFKHGDPWNTSVQYRDNIVKRDTFSTGGFTAIYKFTVNGDFDKSGMQAVVERPHLYKVLLNGKEIKAQEGKSWLDPDMGVFNIENEVKQGENQLMLEVAPMKIHAEIEPVYILGNFSLESAKKGWKIVAPVTNFGLGSWKAQGWPFYAGTVSYTKNYAITDNDKLYHVKLADWAGTVAEVMVNGKSAGIVFAEPYTIDVSKLLRKGDNTIEVKVVGSNQNLLGPFHSPSNGIVGPGNFRTNKAQPAGDDYIQLDYGLMNDFMLEKGE